LDADRVARVIERFQVQTIYHAAAYKHVPMVEHNVFEGVRNNALGTRVMAEAALAAGVERFVLISTDKAVRPTNVMGATKRLAELVLQELAERSSTTVFSMVRFGNVLGSSGSVVPLFRRQIEAGGPVTVTHPDITRFFMTIPEAASLVIQAGSMAKGGDVFVLDMGEPVKIVDLARRMIQLMGYEVRSENNPGGDIAIEFSGLRPGEKLYEELLIGADVIGTEHPKIMRAHEEYLPREQLQALLQQMGTALAQDDSHQARQLLQQAVSGFTPSSPNVDLLLKKAAPVAGVVH
jgi:FlaA1/EpsC-like NDP-sugar epimerase